MDLSVREAATLLSRSERTVRAQLVRGELTGRKSGKVWLVRSEDLPLDERRRTELNNRARLAHAAVEQALPKRVVGARPQRSIADIEPYTSARALLIQLQGEGTAGFDEFRAHLRSGLGELAYALVEYDLQLRIDSLRRVRWSWSQALAALHVAQGSDALRPHAVVVEGALLPRLGGLLRWAESHARGRRHQAPRRGFDSDSPTSDEPR